MSKKNVAFICVHNSCRSQIAEAFGKHFASDRYNFYSAGTETKLQINQDAVRIVKQLYGIDMSNQYSKTIDDIPTPDTENSIEIISNISKNMTVNYAYLKMQHSRSLFNRQKQDSSYNSSYCSACQLLSSSPRQIADNGLSRVLLKI